MRKMILLFFIFSIVLSACENGNLEKRKEFYSNVYAHDSLLGRQALEGGFGEKMQNAPTIDSFNYYLAKFSAYNDSASRIMNK